MKRLTSKQIKKILLGVVLSDGHIDGNKCRFDFYSKYEEYAQYIFYVLQQITGMAVKFKVKYDKRGYTGYRVWTNKHVYFKKMYKYIYFGRKLLNNYNVSRINEESLAHIWMCDGYLEHAKNRKKGTVQNIGWLCLEAYPKEELILLQEHLIKEFEIKSAIVPKPWGFGYRIRIGGYNLQKLISTVYPYILNCFQHKTPLFYMTMKRVNLSLPNAKQYIHIYEYIEDIVRHPVKMGQTQRNNHF